MKILLDGTPFTKRVTGIAAFSLDAVKAICDYLPDWELIIAMPQELHQTVVRFPHDKVKLIVSPLFGSSKIPNMLWLQLKFPFIARKYKADIVWSPNKMLPFVKLNKYKSLIIVCDVVWKEYVETTMTHGVKGLAVRFFTNYVFSFSIKKADYIWCISKYTSERLKYYFPKIKQNNYFIGGTCNSIFAKKEISQSRKKEIFKKYDIDKGFLLFVGSLEPRKNLSFLIKMMSNIYSRTGIQLLIVGAKGWKYDDIVSLIGESDNNRKSVVFADYVDQNLLVELYNIAECYVSTALNEGLGLPQLEAMNCGCPVISPHNSAMIEVVEGRGVTVKGWNENEWVNEICKIVTETKSNYKNPDISDYNWEKIILNLAKYICDNN